MIRRIWSWESNPKIEFKYNNRNRKKGDDLYSGLNKFCLPFYKQIREFLTIWKTKYFPTLEEVVCTINTDMKYIYEGIAHTHAYYFWRIRWNDDFLHHISSLYKSDLLFEKKRENPANN